MKLINRVKRDCFPTWEIIAAEPDYFEPTKEIRVKVNKPLGKDSRKIKGNAIASEWNRMKMPYYYLHGMKIKIGKVTKEKCRLLIKIKARVRVPALEEKHEKGIRESQKKEYNRIKER